MQFQYGVLDAIAMRAPCDPPPNAAGLNEGLAQNSFAARPFLSFIRSLCTTLFETSMQEATTRTAAAWRMKTPALRTLSCSRRSTSWRSSMELGRISQTAAGKQQQLHPSNHLRPTAADNPLWPCNSSSNSNGSHASSGSYHSSSSSSTCSRVVLT